MKKVNVLLVSSILEECKEQIAAVSPRVHLVDASQIYDAKHILAEEEEGAAYDKRLDVLLAQAEVMYGYRPPPDVVARAPRLKWFQTFLAGVDHFLDEDLIRSRVTITTMKGLFAAPVAEVALSMMLMFVKRATFIFENKQKKEWVRYVPLSLQGGSVGIIGLGNIGRTIARLCKALGMRVTATRRSAREGDRVRYVDEVIPMGRLSELLSRSDFVVMALPSTPGTEQIVGEKELRAMKQSALFINMGRGSTVDEEALVRALENGWIAGAGLDAYREEPLPLDSRLWDLPNVILFPHVSGRRADFDVVNNDFFCDNLRRYLDGKRLRNRVDKRAGY